LIKVDNLTFRYPGNDSAFALSNVTFEMRKGEKVALMGANGSGKTTFVQCLNGLLKPSEGSVQVDGLSTLDFDVAYEIRRRVGMVFQNPDNQIVTTTVEREIAFGLENLGLDFDEMTSRVKEAMNRFHLEKYQFSPPHILSGGERQQLALASVWVMHPDYLILDEPTSLLDPQGREEILNFLDDRIKMKEMGILLVTQYPEEAMTCDRLIIMDHGTIRMDGHPEDIFRKVKELRKMGLDVPVEVELRLFLKKRGFID